MNYAMLFTKFIKLFKFIFTESNGVAERKNRTLKNMMNAILISSGAPLNLWGEAILSTCHIKNRIPYKKIGITPYEI